MSTYSFIDDEITYNAKDSNNSGNMYTHIEPTAEKYAEQFYAKNHIPSSYRPGNNPKPVKYNFINPEKYNVLCYNI